jgi:hypothetical protein
MSRRRCGKPIGGVANVEAARGGKGVATSCMGEKITARAANICVATVQELHGRRHLRNEVCLHTQSALNNAVPYAFTKRWASVGARRMVEHNIDGVGWVSPNHFTPRFMPTELDQLSSIQCTETNHLLMMHALISAARRAFQMRESVRWQRLHRLSVHVNNATLCINAGYHEVDENCKWQPFAVVLYAGRRYTVAALNIEPSKLLQHISLC